MESSTGSGELILLHPTTTASAATTTAPAADPFAFDGSDSDNDETDEEELPDADDVVPAPAPAAPDPEVFDLTGDDEMEWSAAGTGAGGEGVGVKAEGGVKMEGGGGGKEERRRKKNEWRREKVACKYCGKMWSRSGMARHQKTGMGIDLVTKKHRPCSVAAVAAGVVCDLFCCRDSTSAGMCGMVCGCLCVCGCVCVFVPPYGHAYSSVLCLPVVCGRWWWWQWWWWWWWWWCEGHGTYLRGAVAVRRYVLRS